VPSGFRAKQERQFYNKMTMAQLVAATERSDEFIRKSLRQHPEIEPLNTTGREVYYPARAALERVFFGIEGAPDPFREQSRLNRAKAEREEFNLRVLRGEYLPLGELQRAIGVVLLAHRDRLRALPSRLSVEIAAEADPITCREMMLSAIDESLNEIANLDAKELLASEGGSVVTDGGSGTDRDE